MLMEQLITIPALAVLLIQVFKQIINIHISVKDCIIMKI
ncbi:hypothetical protein ARNL5_01986 [Anaerolineae bacterium]|nr:hypothetical protein ARNL5_01986 [Anaerolineae bacterium]